MSATEYITSEILDLIIIFVQGGVKPWWQQGSKVTYIFEPSKSSIQFFIALNSACGLPSNDVCPIEIILSFLTITHPTDGLDPVAYVRFASVYRNFREEKDFVQFVDKLDVYKKR